ncbi:MAG TPA: hypothetical protein VNH21_12345 [Steroidobacteraceae bacterium]|nr:hypothetical protein [Steroidobacteraceae bacterium]
MSDALDTLRTALAPKIGMKRIPFPTESYQHRSVPLSQKRLLNLMAEEEPSDARTQAALISTPGLWSPELFVGAFASGPVHAINTDEPGVGYFVSGSHAYGYSGTIWDMGEVGVASAVGGVNPDLVMPATIAVSQSAVVFCIPPNAFTAPHAVGSTVNQIGGTFPGANSVTYINNYFAFSQQGYGLGFFLSTIADPTLFDALDFASIEAGTNVMLRAITQAGELWLCGRNGFEIWYNSGDQDFPFRRRQTGGVISYGVGTPRTVAQIDNSVFWLDKDGTVFRSKGYTAERISTHAIEGIIASYGISSSVKAYGLAYAQDGHAFYALTLSGDRTLVYDCNTKRWHDRSSNADGNGPWRANAVGMVENLVYIGDRTDGTVYFADTTVPTDAGVDVLRQAVMPPLWAATHRAFCARLEIEMESGGLLAPGDVTLDWSDDGGINWTGGPRVMNAGTLLETRKRVYTTRLGSFRQRVFRFSVRGHATFYAVDADISGGTAG